MTMLGNGKLLASASKDETVIIWSMERIMQDLNSRQVAEQSDYIISMIDEHQHVIDCIKFAPESSCRIIMNADYTKMAIDLNQTSGSGENANEATSDNTRGPDDSELLEEHKRMDESSVIDANKLTTKQRVEALKQRLRDKKDALKRGEVPAEDDEHNDDL